MRNASIDVGSEQSNVGTTYATKSQDISGWSVGDTIDFYIKSGTAGEVSYIRNCRIYVANSVETLVVLN